MNPDDYFQEYCDAVNGLNKAYTALIEYYTEPIKSAEDRFNKIKEVANLVDTSRETYLDVLRRHVAAQSGPYWDRELYNVVQLGLHIDEAISSSFKLISYTDAAITAITADINVAMNQEGE